MTCPTCGHDLAVHRDGRCRAWLRQNKRCECARRAVVDARADLADIFEGD